MPFHLSRRQFLASSAASCLAISRGTLAAESDDERIALLSDTHIAADAEFSTRDVNMANNLRQALKEVGELAPKPAALLLHGDAAYLKGELGDYETLSKLLKPALAADM